MEGNKLSVKQVIQAPQRPLVSRAVCLVACLPLVAACQRDLTDLEQFRDEVLSRGAGVIEPIPPLSSRSGTITPRIFGRDVFAELDVDGGVADEPPEFLGCPPVSYTHLTLPTMQ